jgi:tRNA (guanine26-N2/guanine27-N2)-dimethyltransferase
MNVERPLPPGFVLHTESTTSILFATHETDGPAPVFLNPVQEYNRDLSVVAIRTWSEIRQKEKAAFWEVGVKRKWAKRKAKDVAGVEVKKEGAEGEASAKRRKVDDGSAVGADVVDSTSQAEAEVRALAPPSPAFPQLTPFC